MSRQERGAINKDWVQMAKAYGMMFYPWVSESTLRQALRCQPGEVETGDNSVDDLLEYFEFAKVPRRDRKDPQFYANVSPLT